MLDVLVDMTALDTPSRQRGIGRYVAGLCAALAERGSKEPSIAGLVRHRGQAAGAVDPSLRFAGDPAGPMSLRAYGRYKMERRLFLGTLAHRIRPALLHLPDPYGTPIDMRIPRITTRRRKS